MDQPSRDLSMLRVGLTSTGWPGEYICAFGITRFTWTDKTITATAGDHIRTCDIRDYERAAVWIQTEIAKNYAAQGRMDDDTLVRMAPASYAAVKTALAHIGYVQRESRYGRDIFIADVPGSAELRISLRPASREYKLRLAREVIYVSYDDSGAIADWVLEQQPLYAKLRETRAAAAQVSERLEKITELVRGLQ